MDSFQFQAGNGTANGFPNPPTINVPTLFDDQDDDMYGISFGADDGTNEEHSEAKRRRIARACDMCRKKKIKCDGKMPSCSHCQNYSTECIFTHVEKKRAPPKGAKYIEGLENRLGRMEALLKMSGVLNDDDGDRTDLSTVERRLADKSRSRSKPDSPAKSPSDPVPESRGLPSGPPHPPPPSADAIPVPQHDRNSPEPTKEKEEEVEALSDMMCSLVTNNCGETRYIGSSSGFSIFSPKGIQWVNEKTGDSSFQEMISTAAVDDTRWVHWRPEIFGDMFQRRVYQPLPPRDEAISLTRDFFDNFNSMFPLFHEPTFNHLLRRQYSRDPYEGSGWWASLNVVLAVAHRLRIMSNLIPKEDDKPGWGYLKNAMGVLTELTMRNTDLLSVQALLGMALYLLGTPNPQPSFFLVAAAIRLSHSIGLHKKGSVFGLNAAEVEQRKRVFWIAYIMDKDICLRSGRPPAQDDDDMTVDLPNDDPADNVGNIPLTDGKGKVNIFRLMCLFAIIESKVYKFLYSAKASKQSDGALLNTIGELDKELEDWKDGIPIDIRPEHEIKATHAPLVLHIVVLHFAYYNCLATIHRMSVHHGYWTSRLSNFAISGLNARPLNPRVFSSAALCVSAARASIHLIKYIPQNDFACVWLILYFPVSSLVTLFANILQNPQDARARSDVKLMNQVVNFLSLLSVTEEQGGVKRMLGVCAEFERIAKVVLEKAEKESRSRRRKSKPSASTETLATPQRTSSSTSQKRPHPETPTQARAQIPAQALTPGLTDGMNSPFNPAAPVFTTSMMSGGDISLPMDFTDGNFSGLTPTADFITAQTQPEVPLGSISGMNNLDMGSFQEPFVPQDLWQMPMTLEWDWASPGSGLPDGMPVNGQMQQPNGTEHQ